MRRKLLFIFLFINGILVYGQPAGDHTPLKPVKDGLSFIAIGDFGRHGAFTQKEVARDMGSVAEQLESTFTISVGDNFYPNGVQSTQDYQWISSFEAIYTNHMLHEPWYVALGNHDYEGNSQAQIDYSAISRRWEMPSRYFEKIIEIHDGKFLQLLVIDTNPFVEKYRKDAQKYLGINEQDTSKQLKWINEKLSNTNPNIAWRIVVGHHPLYSGGKRKFEKETLDIEKLFEPIFEKYKVDLYITGHEHDLQIIKRPNKYVSQFLSGAGSEIRETGNTEGTIFAASVPGFMSFSITNNQLKAYVIRSGKDTYEVVYQTELKK